MVFLVAPAEDHASPGPPEPVALPRLNITFRDKPAPGSRADPPKLLRQDWSRKILFDVRGTIGDHVEPSGQKLIFGETSSTGAPRPCSASPVPPRVCPDVRAREDEARLSEPISLRSPQYNGTNRCNAQADSASVMQDSA